VKASLLVEDLVSRDGLVDLHTAPGRGSPQCRAWPSMYFNELYDRFKVKISLELADLNLHCQGLEHVYRHL
jgi:hypothetical protein